MNSQIKLTGSLFILAAITFWVSWFLMPDPGTVDTMHILEKVKENRMAVISSVIIQIISSVLYIISFFLLIRDIYAKKLMLLGIGLFAIGTLGLCSDAFFHLLAWFMTDDSVTIQKDVVRVMDLMQTDGVVILLPILLPFFAGSLMMAIGLHQQKLISRKAWVVTLAAIAVGFLSEMVISKVLGYSIPGVMLIVLGLFATGQVLMGLELIKISQKQQLVVRPV